MYHLHWTSGRSRVLVDKAWSAKAPSLVREIPASGKFVHRFKVDEGRGIMIRTTARGGVSVFDLDDIDAVGWSLNSVGRNHLLPWP